MNIVTFYAPGTFVSEMVDCPIEDFDVDKAVAMARALKPMRYGALPYGFRFFVKEDNGRKEAIGGHYYLGGKVETYEEVCARNDPQEEILRWNMRVNGYSRIVVNTNSYRFTAPLAPEDVVLPVSLADPPAQETVDDDKDII